MTIATIVAVQSFVIGGLKAAPPDCIVGAGTGMVVVGNPTPFGPMEMVSPLITTEVGAENAYVMPEMIASDGSIVMTTPSIVVVMGEPWKLRGGTVTDGKIAPAVPPIVMVSDPIVMIRGVVPAPTANVEPETMISEAPIVTGIPSTTVVENALTPGVGADPAGVIVCPPGTITPPSFGRTVKV